MLSPASESTRVVIMKTIVFNSAWGLWSPRGLWSTGPLLPPPSVVLLGAPLIALSAVDVSSQHLGLFEILRNLCHGRCRVKGGYLLLKIPLQR